MPSARYVKKFSKYVIYKKYKSTQKQKNLKNKNNIKDHAKFTLCIMKDEFGFFYCSPISISCCPIGCRSPPNQPELKDLD